MPIYYTILLVFLTVALHAQSIAINSTGVSAHTSAILDVSSSEKGFLAPRMSTVEMNAILSPAKGLLIYNTTTNQFWTNAGNALSPNWQPLASNAWSIGGNSGTNPATQFIGTIDNVPLIIRVNNAVSGGVDPTNRNTALGYHASENINSGTGNAALGAYALRNNIIVDNNTAIGDSSLFYQTGGNGRNVAIGAGAGVNTVSGANNTYVGYQSGHETYDAKQNTAIGGLSLYANTNGFGNTAIGYHAMYNSNRDTNNVVIGRMAFHSTGSEFGYKNYSNVIIGDSAYYGIYYGTEKNTIIGHAAARTAGYGSLNVLVGYQAMANSVFLGSYNIALGHQSMYDNYYGVGNIAIGKHTLYHSDSGSDNNVAIGTDAFYNNTSGFDGIAIGQQACFSNTAGTENIGIGKYALYSNTQADNNIAIGDSVLYNVNNGGGQNTAIGTKAGYSTTNGDHNCFIGSQAARLNTTGDHNVAIGYLAMQESTAGDGNTCIGRQSGDANLLGNNNTLIGSFCDVNADNYINSTGLGHNANITASNQVRIGEVITTSIGGYQNWSNVSDGRFKRHVQENVPGLDFIRRLHPVTYQLDIETLRKRMLNDEENALAEDMQKALMTRTGFIAQEVELAAREIGFDFSGVDVPKNEKDIYGLRYAEFTVPLVKAVQELLDKIETEEVRISELEQINQHLTARLFVLENAIFATSNVPRPRQSDTTN